MKILCLMSTGIDSPVAAYLMLKKGYDVEFVHMKIGNSNENARKIKDFLSKKFGKKLKIHIINHEKFLENASKKLSQKESQNLCVICKRQMIRSAAEIAKRNRCDFLLTGDNLSQVASQTIQNIKTESNASKIQILRPLIGLNKEEIINISKKAGLFNLSVKGKNPCKFVPKKPATKSDIGKIKIIEEKIQ